MCQLTLVITDAHTSAAYQPLTQLLSLVLQQEHVIKKEGNFNIVESRHVLTLHVCFRIESNIHTYLVKPYGQTYHRSSKQAGDFAVTTGTATVTHSSFPPLLVRSSTLDCPS